MSSNIQALVEQLQQTHFDCNINVTFGITTDVTGVVDGHAYTVHTRKLDAHSSVYEQLEAEVRRDVETITNKHPEYHHYHIRIHSLQGNMLRYGKLVVK